MKTIAAIVWSSVGFIVGSSGLRAWTTPAQSTTPDQPIPIVASRQRTAVGAPEEGGALTSRRYRPHLDARWGQTPLLFEANHGQTDARVQYLARGKNYLLFLSPSEAVFRWSAAESDCLRARLLGANPNAPLQGLEVAETRVNYFRGQQPQDWRTQVPTFRKVKCSQVYPGVDLVYYGRQGELEFDFVVAPGVDPRRITLAFSGVTEATVDRQGDLVLQTPGGQLRHQRPLIYQEIEGQRREIQGGYQLVSSAQRDSLATRPETKVAFEVGAYDPAYPLVIDPVLSFATYLGGSGDDQAFGVAVDSAGAVYLTGQTASPDFPGANSMQKTNQGGYDVFVAKFDPSLAHLVYATYLGGSGVDRGFHLAVDQVGNAIVVGVTSSTNFPTDRAFQATYGGGERDGFIAKISASGSALIYASYLGGNSSDDAACVAVDRQGNAYVGGDTASTNFPTYKPLQGANRGNPYDIILSKFGTDGAVKYSTYLGGTGQYESAIGIAVDGEECAYLTGYTSSSDFPLQNPLQTFRGEYDAFVTKVNAAGTALLYSTYLGGSANDVGRSIAVDRQGQAYVSGDTFSTNFPLVKALQPEIQGRRDIFVAKLQSTGNALLYSTYLGGAGDELAVLTADATGKVYLAGLTSSTNFPLAQPLQSTFGGGTWDAFAVKLDSPGDRLIYSTYLGGSDNDQGAAIAIDRAGNAYIAGSTASANFPATKAIQAQNRGGSYDAFLVKLSEPTIEPKTTVSQKTPETPVITPKTNEVTTPAPQPSTPTTPSPVVQTPTLPMTNAVPEVTQPTPVPGTPTPPSQPQRPTQPTPVLHQTLLSTNLIVNGGAENGPAARSSYIRVNIPGWTQTNALTVLRYGMPGGFPGTNDPGPMERGLHLFVGGPDSAQSVATQTVDVSALESLIDSSQVACELSGYLGGIIGQHDHAQLEAFFKNSQEETLGRAAIGPVTLPERGYKTALLPRTVKSPVPAGTRKIEMRLILTRVNGSYNEAFADNLSLMLIPAKK